MSDIPEDEANVSKRIELKKQRKEKEATDGNRSKIINYLNNTSKILNCIIFRKTLKSLFKVEQCVIPQVIALTIMVSMTKF